MKNRSIYNPILWVALAALLFAGACSRPASRDQRVLVYSKTAGYRHASIEVGVEAIRKLGEENGFAVVHTEDSTKFTGDFLKTFSAVIFLSTTGNVLDPAGETEFMRFIQAGGGFVGIHAATDTEYDWPWYGRLVGGYFKSHPRQQEARIQVVDKDHPATSMLPDPWTRFDEWYNFRNLNPNVKVLMNLDESSYEGGENGADHPISWYHEFDGGRVFYTALGHTEASFSEPLFLQHILGGIKYAIGDNRLDYSKATALSNPDPTRYVKTVLASNLDEPMELDMLPDGRILFVERKGNIKLFNPVNNYLSIVTRLPVFTGFEDGLLGLAIDPNFAENNWIYLFYSDPDPDNWEQHISRFVFRDDSLHFASEKILLRIPVQREECCHSGGALEFGPDGLLYITTGDDTNPFASDGYAPIDERSGRSSWDAQRSSANTNDLRGKILRIRPEDDGTYSIPDGNLFPEGTANTRPEIYVMGCRNPFRPHIDQRRNWLFWGDVGPDAGKDGPERGPKGLDGINLAMSPGFWGWPYTRGNNQQYFDYDFATGRSGPRFDPERPVNESPNNTGLRELPPARSSLIWYSYDASEEFPWVGTGGKNPMAGPVYYSDQYPAATRLPAYLDGKLIIYEWMRHWFFAVTIDSNGQFLKVDPFLENNDFSRPMDVIVGNDGRLYMLEYGTLWFERNLDARLSRIDYIRGNRGPVARIDADRLVGGVPFTVDFSAQNSVDLDGDQLTYEWWVGNDRQEETKPLFTHTFQYPGTYEVRLKVRDPDGRFNVTSAQVQVGNDPPAVAWDLGGNQTFYWDYQPIPYRVSVSDTEDGSTAGGGISPGRVVVSIDYLAEGVDVTEIAQGHAAGMAASRLARGAKLIDNSDCKNCHAMDKKVNGPSYIDIAGRYRDDPGAENFLARKIITGGSGNWGETAMSAHPTLTSDQATEIARYILSLGKEKAPAKSMPLEGVFAASGAGRKDGEGSYVFMATYTDLGNGKIESITSRAERVLIHPRVQAENFSEKSAGPAPEPYGEATFLYPFTDGDYFAFRGIDLTGVGRVEVLTGFPEASTGGILELRSGSPAGELIASESLPVGAVGLKALQIDLKPLSGTHDLFFVFRNESGAPLAACGVDWVLFEAVTAKNITSRIISPAVTGQGDGLSAE